MNANRANYVWDYDITQEQFDRILAGHYEDGPLITETDYEAALAELDSLIGNVEPGTPEGHRYELLASLVEAYEAEHYAIESSADPIAMIEFVLEARELTRKDLEPYIGTRQRVWDIMEKRRRLTLPMIRRLEKGLDIPAEVLIQEYELQ